MAKIVGIRPSSFKGNDGAEVNGQNIYLTEPLDNGEGLATDRVFLTNAKLAGWAYKPVVGDEVEISYNRYGRVSGMAKKR